MENWGSTSNRASHQGRTRGSRVTWPPSFVTWCRTPQFPLQPGLFPWQQAPLPWQPPPKTEQYCKAIWRYPPRGGAQTYSTVPPPPTEGGSRHLFFFIGSLHLSLKQLRTYSLHFFSIYWLLFLIVFSILLFIFGPHLAWLFRHFSGVSKSFCLQLFCHVWPQFPFHSAPFWLISKGKFFHISIDIRFVSPYMERIFLLFIPLQISKGSGPIPLILLPVLYTVIEDSAVQSARQSCWERRSKWEMQRL